MQICFYIMLTVTLFLCYRQIMISWDDIIGHEASHHIDTFRGKIYTAFSNVIGTKLVDMIYKNQMKSQHMINRVFDALEIILPLPNFILLIIFAIVTIVFLVVKNQTKVRKVTLSWKERNELLNYKIYLTNYIKIG